MIETRVVWFIALPAMFLFLRVRLQRDYYRAYFEQKQRNAGRDPKTMLRDDLGTWIHWVFF